MRYNGGKKVPVGIVGICKHESIKPSFLNSDGRGGIGTAEEQRLFRWLAVFVGGCTLETAEAMVHMVGKEAHDLGIGALEGVSSLIDKSLLQQTEQEGAYSGRFGNESAAGENIGPSFPTLPSSLTCWINPHSTIDEDASNNSTPVRHEG